MLEHVVLFDLAKPLVSCGGNSAVGEQLSNIGFSEESIMSLPKSAGSEVPAIVRRR